MLDFYSGSCAHRATCLKADGKDIIGLKLILTGDSDAENETSIQSEPVRKFVCGSQLEIEDGSAHLGAPKAITATARKLGSLIYRLIEDGPAYQTKLPRFAIG